MSGQRAAVAVLDDWQGVARGSADRLPLDAGAALAFFATRTRRRRHAGTSTGC